MSIPQQAAGHGSMGVNQSAHCPSCRAVVSPYAVACPSCGAPLRAPVGLAGLLYVLAGLGISAGWWYLGKIAETMGAMYGPVSLARTLVGADLWLVGLCLIWCGVVAEIRAKCSVDVARQGVVRLVLIPTLVSGVLVSAALDGVLLSLTNLARHISS